MARPSSKYFESVIRKLIEARQSENIVIDESFKAALKSKIEVKASVVSCGEETVVTDVGSVVKVGGGVKSEMLVGGGVRPCVVAKPVVEVNPEILSERESLIEVLREVLSRNKHWFAIVPSMAVLMVVGVTGLGIFNGESADLKVNTMGVEVFREESADEVEVETMSFTEQGMETVGGEMLEESEFVDETEVTSEVMLVEAEVLPKVTGVERKVKRSVVRGEAERVGDEAEQVGDEAERMGDEADRMGGEEVLLIPEVSQPRKVARIAPKKVNVKEEVGVDIGQGEYVGVAGLVGGEDDVLRCEVDSGVSGVVDEQSGAPFYSLPYIPGCVLYPN